MTGALLSFTTMALSVRSLSKVLSIFEILTLRSCFGVVFLLCVVLVRPSLRPQLATRRVGLNVVRNATHFISQYAWATSLTLLPLATVFSLEFTMPFWATLLAVVILNERLTPGRIVAVVLGLIGVLVILRPGIATFHPASLLILGAAFGYAVFNILTKKISETDSVFSIVFWMNAMQAPIGLAGSDWAAFLKLGYAELPAAFGFCIAGMSAHFCLTNAYRWGDAMLVLPIDFLRVPLIAVIGWWFFGETIDIFVFLGAAIMLAGILWNLRTEAKKAQPIVEDP